jgi:hypothetical protein
MTPLLAKGHCAYCGKPSADARVEVDGTVTLLCSAHAPARHYETPACDTAKLALEAERYRMKSEEVRSAAEAMRDRRARDSLLSLARDYEVLAERAEGVAAQRKRRAG